MSGGPPNWPGNQPPPQQQWGGHQGQPYPQQESSGKATASMVLGIVSLVLCPYICAIAALITGYSARKEIDRSGGRIRGRGNAKAGIIMGWISLVFYTLLFAVLIAIGALVEDAANDNDFDNDFNQVGGAAIALVARGVGVA